MKILNDLEVNAAIAKALGWQLVRLGGDWKYRDAQVYKTGGPVSNGVAETIIDWHWRPTKKPEDMERVEMAIAARGLAEEYAVTLIHTAYPSLVASEGQYSLRPDQIFALAITPLAIRARCALDVLGS